jgi:hypothetical protein
MHPQHLDSACGPLGNEILKDVHAFVRETGISETALARCALNDGSAIARLRAGKNMTLRNADRLRAFMIAERARRGGADPQAAAQP